MKRLRLNGKAITKGQIWKQINYYLARNQALQTTNDMLIQAVQTIDKEAAYDNCKKVIELAEPFSKEACMQSLIKKVEEIMISRQLNGYNKQQPR